MPSLFWFLGGIVLGMAIMNLYIACRDWRP